MHCLFKKYNDPFTNLMIGLAIIVWRDLSYLTSFVQFHTDAHKQRIQ